ncbi:MULTISPECIES: Fic family protein [unclassified Brevundimonas]|uniref:Fic family protein n=1 Tax=unclassified Brevundimonas TaxID=2622653 RepID=UPI0025BF2AE2|nr:MULTISPECIES: Fic family protein [unclassified Brevundimonas]
MKIPARPPKLYETFERIAKQDPSRLARLLANPSMVDEKGRYLHWDDFRFKLGVEGISSEEAWVALKIARNAASQKIGITDTKGTEFTFSEPPKLKETLRHLDMNAGGSLASDQQSLTSGEGKLYLTQSLAEEPFASSLIEGAATTRQIAKKLIFEGRSPRTKDELMVLNNYRALEFVKQRKDDPLTIGMILELHKLVTDGTMDNPRDSGRVRSSDDVQVVDDSSGEILHQPPSHLELSSRLVDLVNFANSSNHGGLWIHPLVRAFILHFLLSYEHPFVDGNGRVARALFYWLAIREGYWLIEYVSISSVIAESKIQYGKSFLHVETDDADLTYFLIYNAKILETAISRLISYVDRRKNELSAFESRLSDRSQRDGFNHRQSWVLNEMARGRLPRINISTHADRQGVAYLTARADLEDLTVRALLRKTKVGRESIYSPARDLLSRLTTG